MRVSGAGACASAGARRTEPGAAVSERPPVLAGDCGQQLPYLGAGPLVNPLRDVGEVVGPRVRPDKKVHGTERGHAVLVEDVVPALDCQSCGALTPGERFRYYADQIVCDACDERNPQSRRRLVPRALLQPRSICVNFVDCRGLAAQAMALDPLSHQAGSRGHPLHI